jgi:hypothetical protein
MNRIRPFEVGTTVKWCEDGRECAGIVVELRSGDTSRVAEVDLMPTYVIRRPDLSEVTKPHPELVVV